MRKNQIRIIPKFEGNSSLSPSQEKRLMISYNESFDSSNHISHEETTTILSKWLA